MNKKIILSGAVICLGFLLTQLSSSLFFPALPKAMDYFATSSNGIKSFLTYLFIGYAIGQLLWGSLSDRFGRIRVLQVAASIYTIGAILTSISYSLTYFYLSYSIMGLGCASFTSIGNAILKDNFSEKKLARAIAVIGLVMASGPTVGAFIGTILIHTIYWKAIFWFLTIYGALLVVSMSFLDKSKQTNQPSIKQPIEPFKYRAMYVIKNMEFIRSVIILGCGFAIIMSLLDAMPFIATVYLGASTRETGYIISGIGIAYIIGAALIIPLLQKTEIKTIVKNNIKIMVIGSIFLIAATITKTHSHYIIIGIFILFIFASGMLVPLGKAATMDSTKKHAGTTASIMKFTQTCFALAATTITAQMNTSTTLLPIAALLIALAVIATIAFYAIKKT